MLILGHLRGDGFEIPHQRRTTERPSTEPMSSEPSRLIADPDLTHIDPRPVDSRQILHQFPEVDPSFRGVIETDLVAVELILHIHKLHLQAMFCDLHPTDEKGIALLPGLIGQSLNLLRSRYPQDLSPFPCQSSSVPEILFADHASHILPAVRLHDHVVSGGGKEVLNVQKNVPSSSFELNLICVRHCILHSKTYSQPPPQLHKNQLYIDVPCHHT